MAVLKERMARGFLIVIGIMASLLIMEAALRLFFPPNDCLEIAQPDSTIGWILRPNYSGVCVDSGGQSVMEITINSLGLRDTSVKMPKPRNTFRILILGDSMTFGAGVKENLAYPRILERLFIDGGKYLHIEVINSGVPGYGTGQEYLLYERLAESVQPDLVILGFFVGNDLADNLCLIPNPTRPCFSITPGASVLNLKLPDKEVIDNFRPDTQRNSPFELQTLIFLRTKIENLAQSQPLVIRALNKLGIPVERNSILLQSWYEDLTFEAGWRITSAILEDFAQVVNEDGATLAILVLPERPQIAQKYFGIQNELYQHTQEGELFNQDPKRPQRVLGEWGQENDILVIDPLSVLVKASGEQPVHLPNGHFNGTGNLIIGQYLYCALLESELPVTSVLNCENDP
jgi:hypothetical protein